MIPYEIPVETLTINGVGGLATRGLLVVVGPNSSGKTQLLRDIYGRVTGQMRELVVCTKLVLQKPKELDDFLTSLIDHGALRAKDTSGTRTYESTQPHFGIGPGTGGEVTHRDVQSWYDAFSPKAGAGVRPADNAFLRHFGPMLSTALFLENRLAAVNGTNSFDYTAQKPNNDLQALLLNSDALAKFRTEIGSTFGKAIGLDTTRGGFLSLRVSDHPKTSPLDWVTPDKVRAMRPIESEGDGLRSYAAVCVALLLGARPICLIDEPEICLHAPQEHAIGRFIGAYGTQDETATVIATHSSQVLRGVLETANELR